MWMQILFNGCQQKYCIATNHLPRICKFTKDTFYEIIWNNYLWLCLRIWKYFQTEISVNIRKDFCPKKKQFQRDRQLFSSGILQINLFNSKKCIAVLNRNIRFSGSCSRLINNIWWIFCISYIILSESRGYNRRPPPVNHGRSFKVKWIKM